MAPYPDPDQTIQILHAKLRDVTRRLDSLREVAHYLTDEARCQALRVVADELRHVLQELGLSEKEQA